MTRILQFYQLNSKLPSPQWKQGNYPAIPIYAVNHSNQKLWLSESSSRILPSKFMMRVSHSRKFRKILYWPSWSTTWSYWFISYFVDPSLQGQTRDLYKGGLMVSTPIVTGTYIPAIIRRVAWLVFIRPNKFRSKCTVWIDFQLITVLYLRRFYNLWLKNKNGLLYENDFVYVDHFIFAVYLSIQNAETLSGSFSIESKDASKCQSATRGL